MPPRADQRIDPSRIIAALRACTPASETAALVRDRLEEAWDLERNVWPAELAIAREVVRILSDTSLSDGLSVEAIDLAAAAARDGRRAPARQAAARIRHLLQASTELPRERELRASQRLARLLDAAPQDSRDRLEWWARRRGRVLNATGLAHEMRLIVALEAYRGRHPEFDDLALVTRFVASRTVLVPACPCPPVRKSPDGCGCGATIATAGQMPKPLPEKQERYRGLCWRYLNHPGGQEDAPLVGLTSPDRFTRTVVRQYPSALIARLLSWCENSADERAPAVLAVGLAYVHGFNEHQIARATIAAPAAPSILVPLARRADLLAVAERAEVALSGVPWLERAARAVVGGRREGLLFRPRSRVGRPLSPAYVARLVSEAAGEATGRRLSPSGLNASRIAAASQMGLDLIAAGTGYSPRYAARLGQALVVPRVPGPSL